MSVSLLNIADDAVAVINPADLSIQHLVMQADPVVKVVLVLLLISGLAIVVTGR